MRWNWNLSILFHIGEFYEGFLGSTLICSEYLLFRDKGSSFSLPYPLIHIYYTLILSTLNLVEVFEFLIVSHVFSHLSDLNTHLTSFKPLWTFSASSLGLKQALTFLDVVVTVLCCYDVWDRFLRVINTFSSVQFSSVQSLSRVRLFANPWIAARQASLSITNSWSSLRFTPIESVMSSSHLILCRPLLLLPPINS